MAVLLLKCSLSLDEVSDLASEAQPLGFEGRMLAGTLGKLLSGEETSINDLVEDERSALRSIIEVRVLNEGLDQLPAGVECLRNKLFKQGA